MTLQMVVMNVESMLLERSLCVLALAKPLVSVTLVPSLRWHQHNSTAAQQHSSTSGAAAAAAKTRLELLTRQTPLTRQTRWRHNACSMPPACTQAAAAGGQAQQPALEQQHCLPACQDRPAAAANTPGPAYGSSSSSSGNSVSFPEAPDVSSFIKAGAANAVLLASVMRSPQERLMSSRLRGEQGERPNDPITPEEFVEALEVVVKSKTNEPNPDSLTEILQEVLQAGLLPQFSAQQLVVTLKDLAVFCESLPAPFLVALLRQLGARLTSLDVAQLSNVAWALLRVTPVAHEQQRAAMGLDDLWLAAYCGACEQQLLAVVDTHSSSSSSSSSSRQQEQQAAAVKLPTGQQLANLLLVPAAARRPFSDRGQQLFERAMVLSQNRLCGMAVAQTLTCFVRLQMQPQQELREALLAHVSEDILLYDHDEITQVAAAAAVLQWRLPSPLLADMTQQAQVLETAGRALPEDAAVLQRALDVLARSAAAVVAAVA